MDAHIACGKSSQVPTAYLSGASGDTLWVPVSFWALSKGTESAKMRLFDCVVTEVKRKTNYMIYSEIPLLRAPKFKTFCQLKTLFAKFMLSFPSFSTARAHLIGDHLWDCPKVVFQTTFG